MSLLTQDEQHQARRGKWLADRRKVVTSTDSPILFGVGYMGSSVAKLWGQKTGRLPEDPESYLMRRGKLSEPLLIKLYEGETGRKVIRASGEQVQLNPMYPWLGTSLDAVDEDGVYIELKRTTHKFRDIEEIPLRWQIQVQHQMVVMGGEKIRLVMDQPFEMVIIEVPRNERFIEERLLPETEAFWKSLSQDRPPVPKYGEDNEGLSLLYREIYEPGSVVDLDFGLVADLDIIARCKREEKEIRAVRDVHEAKLKFALGEAETGMFPDSPELKVTWKKTAKGFRTLRITGMEVGE